ncbi:MAG TPA: hypothetical protein VNP02_03520 [Gammaproteobacteria bacterium]|nr:hypothetical protein [Gammaproteobacteria bacterium]
MELVLRGAEVGVWYCPLPFDRLIWDERVKEHFHLPPNADVTIDTFYRGPRAHAHGDRAQHRSAHGLRHRLPNGFARRHRDEMDPRRRQDLLR